MNITHVLPRSSILVIDRHRLVRVGFCALLRTIDGVGYVMDTSTVQDALPLLQTIAVDLIILDSDLPDRNALPSVDVLRIQHPNMSILMVAMNAHEEEICHALHTGVTGYILKTCGKNEFQVAVLAVLKRQTYLSPQVAHHAVRSLQRDQHTAISLPQHDQLTARQRVILRMIAEGYTTQEMAHSLALSVKTIETHRAHLMSRLNIYHTAGLVRYAVRTGVITASSEEYC